jgi:hypothetical protein
MHPIATQPTKKPPANTRVWIAQWYDLEDEEYWLGRAADARIASARARAHARDEYDYDASPDVLREVSGWRGVWPITDLMLLDEGFWFSCNGRRWREGNYETYDSAQAGFVKRRNDHVDYCHRVITDDTIGYTTPSVPIAGLDGELYCSAACRYHAYRDGAKVRISIRL